MTQEDADNAAIEAEYYYLTPRVKELLLLRGQGGGASARAMVLETEITAAEHYFYVCFDGTLELGRGSFV